MVNMVSNCHFIGASRRARAEPQTRNQAIEDKPSERRGTREPDRRIQVPILGLIPNRKIVRAVNKSCPDKMAYTRAIKAVRIDISERL
jgi:hypothetical protein